tara:strand:- start:4062 stop:5690 length:1629 start_codon:yes stop_codon:yes gene_type:complete
MKEYKYTTVFSSVIKPLVSEDKDKYLAMASMLEIGDFIPDIDTTKDIDLLPVAFNACVANRVNKNGDVVDSSTAVAMYESFINKPINLEHQRERVVGVILAAGFSEFGTDKPIAKEDIDGNEPFNITLGGVIWKVVNTKIADIIEDASDPTSENYMKISASWELGFDEYNLVLLDDAEKNISNAEFITELEEIDKNKDFLKALGGSGKLENGKNIYRQVINKVVPLGIGLTESPAADVQGVAVKNDKEQLGASIESSAEPSEAVQESEATLKVNENEKNISQTLNKTVETIKEYIPIMKITSIKDITDESLQSLKASVIADFVEEELKKASEDYHAQQTEVEDKLKAAHDEHDKLKEEHTTTQKDLEEVKSNLETLQTEVEAKEAQEKFNTRMTFFDAEYELTDADREVIASDIKSMDDEAFNSFASKMKVLLEGRQKYGGNKGDTPDADRKKKGHYGPGQKKKETADEEGEEDDKKLPWLNKKKEKAKATETEETPQGVVEEALENAEEVTADVPSSSEAQEETVYSKYKAAFALDQFEIK